MVFYKGQSLSIFKTDVIDNHTFNILYVLVISNRVFLPYSYLLNYVCEKGELAEDMHGTYLSGMKWILFLYKILIEGAVLQMKLQIELDSKLY